MSGLRTVRTRPGLATITRSPGADGVAHVGRLLFRALTDLAGAEPWVADLDPAVTGIVSRTERARFAARIGAAQLLRRADAIIYNHPGIAAAHRLLPARLRVPYGVFVHGIEVWGEPLPPERLAVLEGADLLMSNSHFTARRVMDLYPQLGTVHACPLALFADGDANLGGGVDTALLDRVGARSVLIAGRMSRAERYKGHDELLQAWSGVRRAVPDAQLVVVGGGDDVDRLRAEAVRLKVDANVLFGGRVSDATLAALFDRTRAFAMPSRGEGFGIVYLQAMRAGRPCLGATDDAATDVIVNEETGLLVAQHDRAGLTAALVRLLTDDEACARMGAAGRSRFEREFSYERFRARLGDALAAGGFAASEAA